MTTGRDGLMHVIECSAKAIELKRRLADRRSVLAIGPRFFGKSALLEACARASEADGDAVAVRISSVPSGLTGQVDYTRLWSGIRGQLGNPPRTLVRDQASFLKAFEAGAIREQRRIVVFVDAPRRGNEECHYEVLATLHRLMVTRPALGRGAMTVIAFDDYALFYWQRKPFLESPLHSFQPEIHLSFVDLEDIVRWLEQKNDDEHRAISGDDARQLAQRVFECSGGHPGIAQELLMGLSVRSWNMTGTEWDAYARAHQKHSSILEKLNQALAEDPHGYTATALEYTVADFPEANSPRVHRLRQLGILQRETAATVRLCSGTIGRMVEEFSRGERTPTNVGTVLSEAGPRLFVAGQIDVEPDDVVVVHLSDLHVSSSYYKHRLPGGQLNKNEHTVGELVRDDLKTLGFLGRVDALLLTGDFVWNGEMEEFLRAREVIEDLMRLIGVTKERVLFVPGNHDMKWNPGSLSDAGAGRKSTREHYDAFVELLDKPSNGRLDVLEVASPSGATRLTILGLDSNHIEGPEAPGIGYVSNESLKAAKEYIDTRERGTATTMLTWIAVHHHIFPASSLRIDDAERKKVSVMGNAPEILDLANRLNVEAVVHGHEHQPGVTVARRWPIDVGESFSPIVSIGAGSVGATRECLGPFSRNHYYVIHRRRDEILIRSRTQGATGVSFIGHSDLQIPCRKLRTQDGAPQTPKAATSAGPA